MTAFVSALVSAGYGRLSFLELFWLLVGLACAKDAVCLLLEARRTLAAVDDGDEVERLLAVVDLRGAAQAVLVQVCFLGVGVVAALRPPPSAPADTDTAMAGLVSIVLLLAIQASNIVGAHERHRYSRKIDEALRVRWRSSAVLGERRWYDPGPRG